MEQDFGRGMRNSIALTFALLGFSPIANACTGDIAGSLYLIFHPAGERLILAHRGLWGKYYSPSRPNEVPENSIAAIDEATWACQDGMELDVKMTSDGVPVLMHDTNLGRTTDAWTKFRGGIKFEPGNTKSGIRSFGTNPTVNSVSSAVVTNMRLLTPDRKSLTYLYVPTVQRAIRHWINLSNQTVPLIFDVKTTQAVRAVRSVAESLLVTPEALMAMKVNASLYQSRAAYAADSPKIKGIPVFVTNNVSKLNVQQVLENWSSADGDAVEINLKTRGGFLDYQIQWQSDRGRPYGVFNAIPDYPFAGGLFYYPDGHCCYSLSDLYVTYNGTTERVDQRGEYSFMKSEGFTFITSDDPIGLRKYLGANK